MPYNPRIRPIFGRLMARRAAEKQANTSPKIELNDVSPIKPTMVPTTPVKPATPRSPGIELNDVSPVKPTMVPTTPVKPAPQLTPRVSPNSNGNTSAVPLSGAVLTATQTPQGMAIKKGGHIKSKAKSSYSSGGKVSSASKRGDGIAQRGKTKCKVI